MNERFPSSTSDSQEQSQEMPIAFTVESGVRNTFPTRDAEGNPTGNIFVKKEHSDNAELADGYIHEDDANRLIDQHESMSDEEKDRVRKELGDQAVRVLVSIAKSPNGKSQHLVLDALVDGERVGGGGKMFKQEQESGLRPGAYLPARALASLQEVMAASPVGAEVGLITPVGAQAEAVPFVSPIGVEAPIDTPVTPPESPRNVMRGETYAQVAERQEKEHKRKRRWFMAAGAAALVAISMFAPNGGGDSSVEARSASSVGIEAEAPADPVIDTDVQIENQESDIDEAASHASHETIDTSTYEYPWNWAAEQFGEADASGMLHDLAAKAQQAGHEVAWYEDGVNQWVEIDGVSETAPVVELLSQYR